MACKARQDLLISETEAVAAGRAPLLPHDLEKLRLKFDLELLQSQNAGAGLDPLLRRESRESGVKRPPGA